MSTMTKIRKTGALVAPLTLALALGGVTPVSAATQARSATTASTTTTAEECASADAKPASGPSTDMNQVTGAATDDPTSKVASAVKSGKITTKAPLSALSTSDAKVYTVQAEDVSYTSVTVPVGGEYSRVSNLTVVFDSSGAIVQSGETLISENSSGNFNISNFADGKLVKSNDTDRPFMTDAQLKKADAAAKAGTEVSTKSAKSTAACVAAVLGVSGATAYLIVGACAGACTIPIAGTAICVACIGAYAAVGGASISAVASCF